jgi:hypothetical protein
LEQRSTLGANILWGGCLLAAANQRFTPGKTTSLRLAEHAKEISQPDSSDVRPFKG